MANNLFNIAEILDMAIEKEKKRRDFYALVNQKFTQTDMKELFGQLHDWEDEHVKKFTGIRNTLEESEVAESYQGEFEAYIKVLVDDMLYAQITPEKFENSVKNPIDAIKYGMSFERDAILFFNELSRHMSPSHREKILELIDEEKKHLLYLARLKNEYMK